MNPIHYNTWASTLWLQFWAITSDLPKCHDPQLSLVNKGTFALALFLCFGIVGSYLPQHYRIISRASPQGLSPWFILLGATSSTCALAAVSSLPITRTHVHCCKELNGFACFAGLLTALQIGLQWLCFFIIFVLYDVYLPRQDPDNRDPNSASRSQSHIRRKATIVSIVVLLHLFISITFEGLLYARFPQYLMSWANINGTISPMLAVVQYLPQIWTTFRLKSAYSLSIPMMIMQVPGSFIFALSIGLDVGWSGWSVWLMYCITGVMQSTLLVLALKYAWDAAGQRSNDTGKGAAAERSADGSGRSDGAFQDEPGSGEASGSTDVERSPYATTGHHNTDNRSNRARRRSQSDSITGENTPLLKDSNGPNYTALGAGDRPSSAESGTGSDISEETDDETPKATANQALGYFPSSSPINRAADINIYDGTNPSRATATRRQPSLGGEAASLQSQESFVTAVMYNDDSE